MSRFADPVSQEEMEVAAQGVVSDNTKRNNEWAANNLAEWAKGRAQKSPEEHVPDNLLSCSDEKLLCKRLCRYVMETRQASGKPYPPKSIYALLCGLLRIVRSNGVLKNVTEKIIAKTGHRSLAGLRAYEHTTHAQEQAVTKSLSSSNVCHKMTKRMLCQVMPRLVQVM